MKYSRVMCLVRGGDSDKEAIDVAVSLLSSNNRSLQLVYVIVVDRRYALDSPNPGRYNEGERVLRDAEFMTGLRSGVRGSILQSRSIGPVLIREALDFGAEVIVAASSVKIGIFTTSNAKGIDADTEYLMTNAPCAVVLVREPAPDFDAALRGLNQGNQNRISSTDPPAKIDSSII